MRFERHISYSRCLRSLFLISFLKLLSKLLALTESTGYQLPSSRKWSLIRHFACHTEVARGELPWKRSHRSFRRPWTLLKTEGSSACGFTETACGGVCRRKVHASVASPRRVVCCLMEHVQKQSRLQMSQLHFLPRSLSVPIVM